MFVVDAAPEHAAPSLEIKAAVAVAAAHIALANVRDFDPLGRWVGRGFVDLRALAAD